MAYSKCLVDISKSDEEIISEFAKIDSSFEEWLKTRDDKLLIPSPNIIKYLVACYDIESEIVREYKQRWTVKKREAAKLSGILDMREEHPEHVDDILYCRNVDINYITVKYLGRFFDRDILMYAIYNELLINQSMQLLSFDFNRPSDVASAKNNVEDIQEDIDLLEQKIFSGDDVKALKNILLEYADKFMVHELRPESLVSKIEDGKMVVESPYGDGYSIDKLRFLGDK